MHASRKTFAIKAVSALLIFGLMASLPACSPKSNSPSPSLPPDAPANVGAAGGNTVVTITWDASDGATSYNIYWSTSAGVSTSDTKVTGVISPWDHAGRTGATAYYYIVTAVGEAGESDPSSEVTATSGPIDVYVNGDTGHDSNDGAMNAPKATIGAGILAATGLTGTVHVAERGSAVYDEALALATGVSIKGGYSDDFSANDPAVYVTEVVRTPSLATVRGIDADDLTIEGLFVQTGDIGSGAALTSAIAIHLHDCNDVVVRNCLAIAGAITGPGVSGADGGDGAVGGDGGAGVQGVSGGRGGTGGVAIVGWNGGSGGDGGVGNNPGNPGSDGDGSGGMAGTGGATAAAGNSGNPGSSGSVGSVGTTGAVGTRWGSLGEIGYVLPVGEDGTDGTSGAGGGGGGGGAGALPPTRPRRVPAAAAAVVAPGERVVTQVPAARAAAGRLQSSCRATRPSR